MGGGENPWAVLGLERTADTQAVKSQWRKLAMQYHPDLYAARHCVVTVSS